jgi:AAA domain
MKEHPDINDTLKAAGVDAVRQRHDNAKKYQANGGDDPKPRFKLVPFNELKPGNEPAYLVKGLIPRQGLVVKWGPPKCGKSFETFDMSMHIALGWSYRGHRVQQGPVVYCAFEGSDGFKARAEAFRRFHAVDQVPFFLVAARVNMVVDYADLITSISQQIGDTKPVAVVLDTLNRSLAGSESNDQDMTAYIHAADAVREVFGCAVIIVHHCGIEGTRPRGHTSLTGAVDAQLSVKRDAAGNIEMKVEWMKDGPEGETIWSRLEPVEVGIDQDGEKITSCVVVPVEAKPKTDATEQRLTPNQQTMFTILFEAGERGLSTEAWNQRTREVGIGTKRPATLLDIRSALKAKGCIREITNGWAVNHH